MAGPDILLLNHSYCLSFEISRIFFPLALIYIYISNIYIVAFGLIQLGVVKNFEAANGSYQQHPTKEQRNS